MSAPAHTREIECLCAPDPIPFSAVLDAEDRLLHGQPAAAAAPFTDNADESQRLAAVRVRLHARKLTALCLSGGGIRSATVSLGVLQALARRGLVQQFDYLSTVSGGGYTGGWLTRWRYEVARGADRHAGDPLDRLGGDPDARCAEPAPVDQLRRYSRFLDPKVGMLSADVWAVIVTIATNLALNWLVLVPLVAAGVMVPLLHLHLTDFAQSLAARGDPSPAFAFEIAGTVLIAVAVGFAVLDLPSSGNARRSQAQFLIWMLAPLCVGKLMLSWSWVFAWMWQSSTSPLNVVMRDGVALAAPFLAAPIMLRLRPRSSVRWRPGLVVAGAAAGAIGGLADWAFRRHLFYSEPYVDAVQCDTILRLVAAFDIPVALLAIVGQIALLVGFGSHAMTDDDREWWARTAAWAAIVAAVWAGAGTLTLFGPGVVQWIVDALPLNGNAARGLLTVVTFFGGSVAARRANVAGALPDQTSPANRLQQAILVVALPLLLALMLALIADMNLHALHLMRPLAIVRVFGETFHIPLEEDYWQIRAPELWLLFTALIAGALVMSRMISVNVFSLHGMYRNRLVRSFLGASRPERRPNPFTGFDAADDATMWELRSLPRPLHVVNITLNQVTDNQLAWQERRSLPFTITPLHAGCSDPSVGFRCAAHYSDGIRLGTAIAISGAAVSSRMGEHSSPLMSFLLTMFNARLGVWKGNPAIAGNNSWRRTGPPIGVMAIVNELISRTSATNPYVYLSDGGHFENLGLYEMVQRRCHRIIVSDAAADPGYRYEDLANAVRKIRIDLGIAIEFPDGLQIAGGDVVHGSHYAVGRVGYSAVDPGAPDGVILYLKTSLTGDEPVDVANYAKAHRDFPNESTVNQWFSEAQFESYRALGQHMVESVAAPDARTHPATIEDFFDAAIGRERQPVG
jgi:hypothetical protein